MPLCRYPLLVLRLFESAHAARIASLDGGRDMCCGSVDAEKFRDPVEDGWRVPLQILISQEKKIWIGAARSNPTSNVLAPGDIEIAPDEAICDVLFNWIRIVEHAIFSTKIIKGDRDVAWVPDEIDHFRIARIEIFMALDDTRPRDALQCPARTSYGVWNDVFDVCKRYWYGRT